MQLRHLFKTSVLIVSFCLTSVSQADELLNRAELLINQNNAAEAYKLLSAQLEERAGTPDFDLLLGIAALNSGEPTQSVFALERVLAVQPENARARAELARAYFEMGENEAAKEEFNEVKDKPLPAAVAGTIDKYLTAIEARTAKRKPYSVFIDAAFGYDSNVNSATDSSNVAIPAFGNLQFTLDDTGQELDSGFISLAAGATFSQPVNSDETLRVFGSGYLNERYTYDATDFRTRIANGQIGLRYTQGDNAFLASLNGQKYYIDQDTNRNQAGINLQWLHSYSERTQFSVFGQWAAQRFPDQEVRNVNQFSGGVGVVHAMKRQGDPVVFASVFVGTDDEIRNSRADIGRDFFGIRGGGQYTLNEKMLLVGSISYQYSKYGDDDPLFLTERKDHFVFVRAGLEYTIDQNWSVRPELQYSNSDSNIVINDFDRWQALVNVRFKF